MKNKNPIYTLGEEIANSVTHGVGALLAIAACVILIVTSAFTGDPYKIVSCSIYGASLIIMFAMSTLYHALTNEKAKFVFRIFDHTSIFILIAGTYTPIMLVSLRGVIGWVLFGVVWGAAILGIVFNSINLEKYKKISLVCYVLMGWAVVFAIKPMLENVTGISLIFLLIGGVFYTVGIVFYVIKRIKYFHSIWHLFTIAGTVFHYFSILLIMIHDKS